MAAEFEQRSYCLVKGSFDPENARLVLMNLVNDKINFHQLNDWSRRERFGESDSASLKRVEELQQIKVQIMQLTEHASSHGLKLKINCDIEILLEPA